MKIPRPSARMPHLIQLRNLKMARSAHAYVRGSTVQFYEWLHSQPGRRLPHGPAIWICGDCHAGNLGPTGDTKGRIDMHIRDLDQTVIGNPAHDLVRLALSLATAARGSDLPGVTTARMLEEMMVGYEQAFKDKPDEAPPRPSQVKAGMRSAVERTWKNLARERIESARPTIPLGKHFCVGDKDDQEYCLIDIKEAVGAAAPRAARAKMPRDNGRRVVEGARQLSPGLGERMLATRFLDHGFFIRELLPQDMKLELDELSEIDAMHAAGYLARVVGIAHARQMDRDTRKEWMAVLQENRSKQLDAPSWLWTSVVQLVGSHEQGYLNHCRRYALEKILIGLRKFRYYLGIFLVD